MNMTISPPIKILALVGLLAIVAFGASTMLFGHSSGTVRTSTAQPRNTRVVHHVPAKTVPRATTKSHAAAKHSTPVKHTSTSKPAKSAAKTHVKVAAKPAKPVARGNLVYEDLPASLQWQLAQHKVVVVSFYNPHADVDAISVAEAHAGALDANAGFLLVNVLDNKVAGILTALLPGGGLLPEPGVLVYRAPGNVMVRLDGFADRTSVAQAATNALAGQQTGITPGAAPSATPSVATPSATGD